jgi:AraC family transcriptional regulator
VTRVVVESQNNKNPRLQDFADEKTINREDHSEPARWDARAWYHFGKSVLMKSSFSPITLGSVLKTLDAKVAVLTETTHHPYRVLPMHSHELANLTFVTQGSFTETIGAESFECEPGTLLIKPPEESHRDRYGAFGVRCLVIEIRRDFFSRFLADKTLYRVEHFRSPAIAGIGLRLQRELHWTDPLSEMMVQGLLFELLSTLARRQFDSEQKQIPVWLKQVKELLEENFCRSFDLPALAKSVDIHPVHLVRQFKKSFGVSPGEFVRKKRFEFACRQLANTKHSICEIAVAAGFSDHSHFCRIFKQYTGVSPGDYRRSLAR